MEKSSKIILTLEELYLAQKGVFPSRLKDTYGIPSIVELNLIISNREYEVVLTPLQAE
jgi:hypothetical protein